MAEYKKGDRLRGTATCGGWGLNPRPVREGVFNGELSRLFNVDGWPLVTTDNGGKAYLDPREVIEVVKSAGVPRPLVGPAPKVEAPVFVAPFKAIGRAVKDERGGYVLEVDSDAADLGQDEEFAAYVAEALNARVFGEE